MSKNDDLEVEIDCSDPWCYEYESCEIITITVNVKSNGEVIKEVKQDIFPKGI